MRGQKASLLERPDGGMPGGKEGRKEKQKHRDPAVKVGPCRDSLPGTPSPLFSSPPFPTPTGSHWLTFWLLHSKKDGAATKKSKRTHQEV